MTSDNITDTELRAGLEKHGFSPWLVDKMMIDHRRAKREQRQFLYWFFGSIFAAAILINLIMAAI